MLIDVSISGDRNVFKKETEKILKYKDLTIEIQHMWNVKTKVIPVIIGATGTISESFTKYVSNIPGKHEVKKLQKTAAFSCEACQWLEFPVNGFRAQSRVSLVVAINLIVAPCIFVESLQFINQRMHI